MIRVDPETAENHIAAAERLGGTQQRPGICRVVDVGEIKIVPRR